MDLIAGLPPHTAIATNKMSSTCGTALATLRFIKNKLVNFKLEHFLHYGGKQADQICFRLLPGLLFP